MKFCPPKTPWGLILNVFIKHQLYQLCGKKVRTSYTVHHKKDIWVSISRIIQAIRRYCYSCGKLFNWTIVIKKHMECIHHQRINHYILFEDRISKAYFFNVSMAVVNAIIYQYKITPLNDTWRNTHHGRPSLCIVWPLNIVNWESWKAYWFQTQLE